MADPSHSTQLPPSLPANPSNVMKGPGGLSAQYYPQPSQMINSGIHTNGQPTLQNFANNGGTYGRNQMPTASPANVEQSVRPTFQSQPQLATNIGNQSYINGPSQGHMSTAAPLQQLANGNPPFMGAPQHQQSQQYSRAGPPQELMSTLQTPPQFSINKPQPLTFASSTSAGQRDMTRNPLTNSLPLPQTNQQTWQQHPQRQHPPLANNMMPTQSPATSEPPSAKSSRNPSPVLSQRYDAMEGQFSSAPHNNSANASHFSSGALRNGIQPRPPMAMVTTQLQTGFNHQLGSYQTASQHQQFPPPPLSSSSSNNSSFPSSVPVSLTQPAMLSSGRPGGITDRRQYPQQSTMPTQAPQSLSSGVGQNQWQSQPKPQQPSYSQPHPASGFPGPAAAKQIPPNYSGVDHLANRMAGMNMQWNEPIDLLQTRNILPEVPPEPPKVTLPSYDSRTPNCSPDLFRCTLTKIPETQQVLQKSRLPLGILIHPFKDLTQLAVVQCNVIVRCRTCRTYINPFVQFVDQRRWKCNLCFRVNELAEEFQYDPISKTYGDPSRRPEIRSATIEFIAPSEYMLRPPQPAVYLFLLDVSYGATETGYLRSFCETLLNELDHLPGDSRTRIGFMTFDSAIHFYNLSEGLSQPQMMVVSDIEDVFIPCPDNLLVNLNENKELVKDLLQQLPIQFMDNRSPDSAFGAALQAAFKLVSPTGGRVTVMQTCLPNIGPGALKPREDPNIRAGKDVPNLSPANDFYKKLSLDCSGQQVAVDLFLLSSLYCDIATLSGISKFSGGCVHYYPGFHAQHNLEQVDQFERDLKRYLTRKVGFEAVMRIRCTKGLSIHTFHGNFFVRSTDLLSLPNINPDAGFAMQMSIEEPLADNQTACFQAALLYTSSKGERRIRVHTMCLPVTTNVLDVIYGADQQAIAALLTKMAVDRSLASSMSDARDALINACVDAISAFKVTQGSSQGGLMIPPSLKLLPLYILAILKNIAFRLGTSTKLDERVFAMNQMKSLPLTYLMPYLYPNMYPVHNLAANKSITQGDLVIPQPPLLHLSAEKFDRQGVFLIDAGDRMFLYVYQGVSDQLCKDLFRASTFDAISEKMTELPELDNPESERLRSFLNHLQSQRPFYATLQILKSTSKNKHEFLQYLIEDRTESSYSYFEFLKHLQQLVSK